MWLPHVVIVSQVESYDAKSKGLRVVTHTGYRVVIWPWTDDKLGNMTYYPVRPGYASTVMKFQGAECSHVTITQIALECTPLLTLLCPACDAAWTSSSVA